jgi:hypothetical protein
MHHHNVIVSQKIFMFLHLNKNPIKNKKLKIKVFGRKALFSKQIFFCNNQI